MVRWILVAIVASSSCSSSKSTPEPKAAEPAANPDPPDAAPRSAEPSGPSCRGTELDIDALIAAKQCSPQGERPTGTLVAAVPRQHYPSRTLDSVTVELWNLGDEPQVALVAPSSTVVSVHTKAEGGGVVGGVFGGSGTEPAARVTLEPGGVARFRAGCAPKCKLEGRGPWAADVHFVAEMRPVAGTDSASGEVTVEAGESGYESRRPAPPPTSVPWAALEARRTRGDSTIAPPAAARRALEQKGAPVIAVFKVCVDPAGAASATRLKSSGVRAYDEAIESAIADWTFRPLSDSAPAASICSIGRFRYPR